MRACPHGEVYSETYLSTGVALGRSSGGVGGAIVPADGCVDLILRDGRIAVAGPSAGLALLMRVRFADLGDVPG